MSKANLRFSTEILKRFGEELNPNPDQGILELVKNAYDANALACTVELLNTNTEGGIVRVTDTGDGMDEDDIINGWLILGESSKSPNAVTRLGRSPVGNKGLGRLAALRMGTKASLITRPLDITETMSDSHGKGRSERPASSHSVNHSLPEHTLVIDWTEFDHAKVVEDVSLDLQTVYLETEAKAGTIIEIAGLKAALSPIDVKRLARGILLLTDPFEDNPLGFKVELKVPEFADLEQLVRQRYFNEAEFHLVAEVNDQGIGNATVYDFKGEELYSTDHEGLRKNRNVNYKCPAAKFDLWVFLLSGDKFTAKTAGLTEVKEWLKHFGGVHLYIRGFRVSPYGDPANDWLDMNVSRTSSPELRPSTITSIGRLSVSDEHGVLQQKTDRSGIIEGEAFHELQLFAKEALAWLARRRLDERDRQHAEQRVEAPKDVDKAKEGLDAAIKSLPPKARSVIAEKMAVYDRARTREASALRKEVQLYRTLSTAGITSSVFAHESTHPVRVIKDSINQIERRARQLLGDNFGSKLESPVNRIKRQVATLHAFGIVTLGVVDHDKRRLGRVEIHTTIQNVLSTFAPVLEDRQVEVTLRLYSGNPYLRASEAAIESIVTNLLVNGLKALEEGPTGKKKIEISTEVLANRISLRVQDNGPGIKDISLKDIWLPGESTRENGTGLGLSIVRDSARDLGGKVSAKVTSDLGGAEFIVEVPILGA